MKKGMKVVLWVAGVVVAVGLIANGGREETPASPPNVSQEAKATAAPTATPAPKNDPKITLAEFNEIQAGMTYDEVIKIIGGPGTVMSEVGSKGEKLHTIMYSWSGDGVANANATFQEGKMKMKAQFGLK